MPRKKSATPPLPDPIELATCVEAFLDLFQRMVSSEDAALVVNTQEKKTALANLLVRMRQQSDLVLGVTYDKD